MFVCLQFYFYSGHTDRQTLSFIYIEAFVRRSGRSCLLTMASNVLTQRLQSNVGKLETALVSVTDNISAHHTIDDSIVDFSASLLSEAELSIMASQYLKASKSKKSFQIMTINSTTSLGLDNSIFYLFLYTVFVYSQSF